MARKAGIKGLATTLLLILGVATSSATPNSYTPIPQRISVALHPAYNIVSHYALRGSMTGGDKLESALSLHARYAFSFPEGSRLNERYPSAYQGFGIAAYTFYHHDFIGTPLAAYIMQGARIANFGERFSLGYEWNVGVSWGWRPNDAMNSACNIIIGVSLPLTWQITPLWELSLVPNFTHISNGDTHFSNSGANLFSLGFGVTRHFNPQQSNITARRYICASEELTSQSFAQRISYDIVLYGGWRADRFTEGGRLYVLNKRFPLGGLHFQPLYHLNDSFSVGASLDIQADSSLNLYNATTDAAGDIGYTTPSLWQQTEVGVSLCGEIKAPIFVVGLGFGANLYKPGYDTSLFYTQFSLKAFITKRLFLYLGYRYNFKQYTHNMMYGIGIRL